MYASTVLRIEEKSTKFQGQSPEFVVGNRRKADDMSWLLRNQAQEPAIELQTMGAYSGRKRYFARERADLMSKCV